MRRIAAALAVFACVNANAVIPEGSFERCTNANVAAVDSVQFLAQPGALLVIVETGLTTGSIVGYYKVGDVATSMVCHPAGGTWFQTTWPPYNSGRVGTFSAYEVGALQEVAGAGAWGASKAIQIMGWFLAPLLFGSGFVVGKGT